jgi:hypothetical protein
LGARWGKIRVGVIDHGVDGERPTLRVVHDPVRDGAFKAAQLIAKPLRGINPHALTGHVQDIQRQQASQTNGYQNADQILT